jgi:hypothetical protein
VARVRKDSEKGTEGIGRSYGYRPPTVGKSEVGYCGSGMRTAPPPRKSLRLAYGMRRHAKIGMLVALIAAMITLSAMAMAPSATKDAGMTGLLPPVASFADYEDALDVIVDATASADPDGVIVSYAWNFGDGATASGVNVTHTYLTWGTWWITLTVTDDDAMTGTTSTQVTVSDPSEPPPMPYGVWGYVLDASSNPAFLATVTITELATGAVYTTTTDAEWGYYYVNLNDNETGWSMDDSVSVYVVLGTQEGTGSGVIAGGALQVDVALTDTGIPEFPMVVLPVIGMLVVVAVVNLTRRRSGK